MKKEYVENRPLSSKTEYLLSNVHVKDKYFDDDFLLRMIHLSDEYLSYYTTYNYYIKDNVRNMKKKYLDKETILSLAREIISSIDTEYLKDFDSFVYDGRVIIKNPRLIDYFTNTKNKNNANSYLVLGSPFQKNAYIRIVRNYNYIDVVDLVHEFMHHTNSYNNCFENSTLQKELSEYISIYFDININEIDTSWRLRNINEMTDYFYALIIPYLYKKEGHLSYKLYEDFLVDNRSFINPLNYEHYLKIINWFLISGEALEKVLFEVSRYFEGTLLSFSNNSNLSKNNIIKLCKTLNGELNNNKIIDSVKESMNSIEVDESIYNEIDKYIDNYVRIKK